ncbi:metalloregulator ArsR/SmtB family transcription factor [Clostridium sp. E02]|uniref:ArsR/SmtB family transcription factor n=1 Tax=Clostridium sp. E02 TaxID=2487134 RepID=UPI000F52748C|nr:metalloregulator ArsR/SmtB family transcription factor [Clostridium sp. E02]
MEISEYKKNANVFKAFCDENRLMILELLQTGEKCACVLLEDLNISQSTLSHHMKILCESGVVSGRKEGKWIHYSVSPEGSAYAKELLNKITKQSSTEKHSICI